jgi:putative spermidine/putrescine transport system substrate-binding protein
LEIALLADGVAPDALYPLDVERAFRALDRVKPSITVWWEAGEQPAQLLASNEVSMASIWNGRAYNAARAGKPVRFTWNGGLLSSDWWIVPRGSKQKALAEEFIRFASTAKAQAAFAQQIPYGPINPDAFALLPDAVKADLPTAPDNFNKQEVLRRDWWNANEAALTTRFNEWLLK